MKIEIDIEKLVSRSVIDGILNSGSLQEEIESILKSSECQKTLTENITSRINDIIFSESGRKQIDNNIIRGIVNSDKIQNEIEDILEGDEYQKILGKQVMVCLNEAILSEEGKKQIFSKVKDYLESYDVEYDNKLSEELSKWISDLLIEIMKDSFERMKMSNKQ